tara:strand:- start:2613 stop:3689 length:1077 start_codon:yes stop_codon:yes gene_type:complete
MPPIIGHQKAIQTIQSALESGRMHHAWILSGPQGVGKCTLACEMARILLDPQAVAGDFGQGESALMSSDGQLLASGTHPDLHIVRKEDAEHSKNRMLRTRKQANVPLDLLRERVIGGTSADGSNHAAPAYRTSMHGQGKVFILDEAELIDMNGQNALLKTLEEPPEKTWLILVTSRPERLLQTVRSRCDHVRLGPLTDIEMREWVSAELPDTPDVEWLLDWAEGSPGMAVRAEETALRDCALQLKPIFKDLDAGRWRETFASEIASFISDWADQAVKANKNASKDVANKQASSLILRLVAKHLRGQLAMIPSGQTEQGRRVWELANRLAEAEDQIHRGGNLKQVLEGLGAGWSQLCRN